MTEPFVVPSEDEQQPDSAASDGDVLEKVIIDESVLEDNTVDKSGTNTASLHQLTQKVLAFRKERDWEQFHNPKDLALSLSLEAAEVLEWMQWRQGSDLQNHLEAHRDEVGEELSDVLYWVLLLAADLQIDLSSAFEAKLQQNDAKYPVEVAKGQHTKYDKLTGK